MLMTTTQRLFLVCVAATAISLAGCERNPKEWTVPNMTQLTPRLKPLFEKTKTVCFGRFLVDVPDSTTVIWGEVDIPLGISVYPGGAEHVKTLAQKFIDELNAGKAIYHNHVPLLIAADEVTEPPGKIVTGYEDFMSIKDLRINGYFRVADAGIVINSRPLQDDRERAIGEINSIARRLRLRTEDETPTEPGNCIENAFLPDSSAKNGEGQGELIRIGFRLKEFPDTHLSILLNPSNPHYGDSDSLEWQLKRLEGSEKSEDLDHPLLKTRYLRRGARQIHDWLNGFEALSHTPEQSEMYGIHDFAMDFRGVPSDPLKPHADVRMQTGVSDNMAGAIKPSLTDEEAIAVWDKITSTIRVRPTSGTAVKTSQADTPPRRPLGDLAATGRVCPQTGWWQPSEPGRKEGGGRQHFQAGQQMPHVVLAGEPSIWQKLRGERPSYRRATVWQLVEYGEAPPTLAQVVATDRASNDAQNAASQGNHDEDSAKKGGSDA
ncbi:T6SS immunity protein Tli4 family protein [Massilia solisilvae]|uniref:T6SS immunity protein Tli4 family protein n=1 Tax=Massilia solisilvae TaxID=1811225 RepID=A0ABT2BIU1_9BURK|nr:T6SS immunity protein Tli4 family protein [Massilia solisilvae]MCS0607818.1 T6SS immunity protein Tli4 family protein [Massilia solisilvae]